MHTELNAIARQLVEGGKGILAADESTGTIEKRLAKINVPSTEDTRRAYRELLFTAPGIGEYISGVIMYDETIRQSTADGRTFVSVQQAAGIVPGIKVDLGTSDMPGSSMEKVTNGLDGLPARLAEYASLGAKFAKWRAVITIGDGLPTDANIRQNAKDLAAYARMCQDAGIVPIVEPEVLMDGAHSMEQCDDASRRTLTAVFEELRNAGVAIEGMLLKTNMIVPGRESGRKASPVEIADATLREFNDILPHELPAQVFLSGGQSEIEATANLNEMAKRGPHPWVLSFSYGRALQDSALNTWKGEAARVQAAQTAFLHRAKMNSLASQGLYTPDMENAAS